MIISPTSEKPRETPIFGSDKPPPEPKAQRTYIPYPNKDEKKEKEKNQLKKFGKLIKQMEIHVPFNDMIQISPPFQKYVKNLVAGKIKLKDEEDVMLTAECSAIFQKSIPHKCKDPGSYTIPCTIGGVEIGKALLDLGASVNLMPLSVLRKLNCGEVKPTRMTLILADRTRVHPYGILEDVLVTVDNTSFPADFVIMDIEEDPEAPILLGRPFLTTGKALIDMATGEVTFRVDDNEVTFNVHNLMNQKKELTEYYQVDMVETLVGEELARPKVGVEQVILESIEEEEEELDEETNLSVQWLGMNYERRFPPQYEPLGLNLEEISKPLELKELPGHLKYVFLGEGETKPAIISNSLPPEHEEKLLAVLRGNKEALGWSIEDLKGISPAFCMHKIKMEESYKPVVQPQRRLNPAMKEVLKKELQKLMAAGMIYPISYSPWVSPVHMVPKKGGITVMKNEKNELIPTRNVTGWRMCIDYRRLNQATRKDHFPLPFMDQMLERLAGQEYYCFLDGYSGYNQIAVDPADQEKTTFTCPYGVYAYRRMPFGLCNAPATFQRCMFAIFSDMSEKSMEVFMDDFSVFGKSFDDCLNNLDVALKRCVETNLVLNWEKCNFMVTEGIVLGHKISKRGIEVDQAKIEVISKLPPPISVKGVRSFLGHAGFYRRFMKDFSKVSKPLCNLLVKDNPFEFTEECLVSFNTLKEMLVTAPVIVAPDWNLPFELMCDASDYAVGAVLGQRHDKFFHAIYYASKHLNIY
ncbi:hypothetical protein A2U01_0003035 [Trifolium medium]|uniref:Reverse transcriptase domain-containing protein n=1 Tax=Trifolium medium TaxID=97028 RepID=A0A392M7R9_9FABA|nr:hypothetical protein [Trifolium medium]